MFSKTLKTILLIGILSTTGNMLFASDCAQACAKFSACAKEIHKKEGTAKEQETLNKACADTCAKKTMQALGCYDESMKAGGSCTAYGQCIMKYAQSIKSSKK